MTKNAMVRACGRTAYEAIRRLREANGEVLLPPWETALDCHRSSSVTTAEAILAGERLQPGNVRNAKSEAALERSVVKAVAATCRALGVKS